MDLEKIINNKIRSLKKVMKFRESNEWLDMKREGEFDTNCYFWIHCGEEENYKGRLKVLEELKKELRRK